MVLAVWHYLWVPWLCYGLLRCCRDWRSFLGNNTQFSKKADSSSRPARLRDCISKASKSTWCVSQWLIKSIQAKVHTHISTQTCTHTCHRLNMPTLSDASPSLKTLSFLLPRLRLRGNNDVLLSSISGRLFTCRGCGGCGK